MAFNRTGKFLSCSRIEIVAYFSTADHTLWGRPHTPRPDATNILKGVEDALLTEDSANSVDCEKFWAKDDSIVVILYDVQG